MYVEHGTKQNVLEGIEKCDGDGGGEGHHDCCWRLAGQNTNEINVFYILGTIL